MNRLNKYGTCQTLGMPFLAVPMIAAAIPASMYGFSYLWKTIKGEPEAPVVTESWTNKLMLPVGLGVMGFILYLYMTRK